MKQKKNTPALLFIVFGLITFTGCSKYEEGPGISLRTKKSRVVGNWQVTTLKINGADYLNQTYSDVFYCSSGSSFTYTNTGNIQIDWTFSKDGGSTSVANTASHALDYVSSDAQCSAVYTDSNDSTSDTSTWEFASDKEDLKFTYSDGTSETWNIIELRENEMKLKLIDGTDIIEVTLEKK